MLAAAVGRTGQAKAASKRLGLGRRHRNGYLPIDSQPDRRRRPISLQVEGSIAGYGSRQRNSLNASISLGDGTEGWQATVRERRNRRGIARTRVRTRSAV